MEATYTIKQNDMFEALREAFMDGTCAKDNCMDNEADEWFTAWMLDHHPDLVHLCN